MGDPIVTVSPAGCPVVAADFVVDRVAVQRNSGPDIGPRYRLNFIEGSGMVIGVVDDPANDRFNITLSSTTSGVVTSGISGVIVRASGGPNQGPRPRLNFIAASGIAITAADDPTDNEIDITISGIGGGSGTITDGANVNIGGVGVFDGKTGSVLNFRGINTLAGSALTVTLDGPNRKVDLDLDPDLKAIAALTASGLAARTGPDTWALRQLIPPPAGITIANPAGAFGNPAFALANDLAALEGLVGSGIAVRMGVDTWQVRALTQADVAVGSGIFWQQGGNSFGTSGVLGTLDLFDIAFIRNKREHARLTTSGTFSDISSTFIVGHIGVDNDATLRLQAGSSGSPTIECRQNGVVITQFRATSTATDIRFSGAFQFHGITNNLAANVDQDGSLSAFGANHFYGQTGISTLLNVGQGLSGNDSATVTINSGGGGAADAALILNRNLTEMGRLEAPGSSLNLVATANIPLSIFTNSVERVRISTSGRTNVVDRLRIGDFVSGSETLEVLGRSMLSGLVFGGQTSNTNLDLGANAATFSGVNTGRIRMHERITWPDNWVFNVGVQDAVIRFGPTVTLATNVNSLPGFKYDPIIRYGVGQVLSSFPAFDSRPTIQPTGAVADVATLFAGFHSQPLYSPTISGASTPVLNGYSSKPSIVVVAGGRTTVTDLDAYTAFTPAVFSTDIATGCTATSARGVHVFNPVLAGSGSIGTLIGIDIEDLNAGSTNLSIRSISTAAQMRHAGPVRFGSSATGPIGGSILHVDGGYTVKRTTFSNAGYTALVSDYLIAQIGALTAARTIALPAAATAGAGKVYIIADESGSPTVANSIVVDPSGAELIDGAATRSIQSARGTMTIYCNGTAWFILASRGTIA